MLARRRGPARKSAKPAGAVSHEQKVTDFFGKCKQTSIETSDPPLVKRAKVRAPSARSAMYEDPSATTSEECLQQSASTRCRTPLATKAPVDDQSISAAEVQNDSPKRRRKCSGRPAAPAREASVPRPEHAGETTPVVHSAKRRLLFTVPENDSEKQSECTTPHLPIPSLRRAPAKAAVRNLSELRAQLAAQSQSVQRIRERRAEFDKIEDELYKEQIASPTKQSSVAIVKDRGNESESDEDVKPAAYERYAHLVNLPDTSKTAEQSSKQLPLAVEHECLCVTFRSLDVCVALLHKREQLITFEGIRHSLQQLTKRTMRERYLGEIKTIYPESYEFAYEQRPKVAQHNKTNKSEYELIIRPLLDNDLVGVAHRAAVDSPPKSPQKRSPLSQNNVLRFIAAPHGSPTKSPVKSRPFLASPAKILPRLGNYDTNQKSPDDERQRLSGARQLYRAAIFRRRIFERTLLAHKEFCARLTPPVKLSDAENAALQRWHPQFQPDRDVPRIEPVQLVRPQSERDSQPQTATALLTQIRALRERSHIELTPSNIVNALNATAAPEASAERSEQCTPKKSTLATTPAIEPNKTAPLSGVPQALLDKIRARQSALETAKMRTGNDNGKLCDRLERAEQFVCMLRLLYNTEATLAMPKEEVVEKLGFGYKQLIDKDEVWRTVEVLLQQLPTWISVQQLKGRQYVRLQRQFDTKPLVDKLRSERATLDKI